MTHVLKIVILFYVLSTVAYIAYLFFQKDRLQKYGYWLLMVGFGIHSILIGYAFIRLGYVPAQNFHETLSIAGWALAGVFIGFQYKYNLKILGVCAAPLISMIMIMAAQFPKIAAAPQTSFKSLWVVLHVGAIFIGEAAFALACGAGVLYLLQENAIKSKKHGFFFKRLPSLDLIDATSYGCLVVGFTLLTFGLISGFVYAKLAWGRFWGWDSKEVFSGITWMLYAALLHGRLVVGWRGRRAAIMAIIGFAVLIFTFVGVNFLLPGHHGAFTKF